MLTRSLAFLLIRAPVLGADPPPEPPAIAPASLTERGVTFESPVALNWDSLAPTDLKPAAILRDAARRLELFRRRGDFGITDVAFVLPLPNSLRRRHYVLADSAGVVPIVPSELVGTLRIRWGDSAATVASVAAFGRVRASVPAGRGRGFVFSDLEPIALRVEPSARTPDELWAPNGEAFPHRGTPFWTILRQYELVNGPHGSRRWIWVRWRADLANLEAGCAFRFSLFRAGPSIAPVASLDEGCDV